MSLEDFEPVESAEGSGEGGANTAGENIEKFKESAKKGSAGVKRTQKDEKKAKKHDFLLAKFLIEIILNKKYDGIHDTLFSCIDAGYPSNFLLGVMSLIYMPITTAIREISGKEKVNFSYYSKERREFDGNNINSEVKHRINAWVEDTIDIVSIEPSTVHTERLYKLLKSDEQGLELMTEVFEFFFDEINVSISSSKSNSYSSFILSEVAKGITKIDLREV